MCGCNSGSWTGNGWYYGGWPSPYCNKCKCWGGGWAGYASNGKPKGGVKSLGLTIKYYYKDTPSPTERPTQRQLTPGPTDHPIEPTPRPTNRQMMPGPTDHPTRHPTLRSGDFQTRDPYPTELPSAARGEVMVPSSSNKETEWTTLLIVLIVCITFLCALAICIFGIRKKRKEEKEKENEESVEAVANPMEEEGTSLIPNETGEGIPKGKGKGKQRLASLSIEARRLNS